MALLEERATQANTGGKSPMTTRNRSSGTGTTGAAVKGDRHGLSLMGRQAMTVTGVFDVVSFDVSEVLLETEMGRLTIRGSDLHVQRLSLEKGEVDLQGKVDSMTYADVGTYRKQGESLLGRLFR